MVRDSIQSSWKYRTWSVLCVSITSISTTYPWEAMRCHMQGRSLGLNFTCHFIVTEGEAKGCKKKICYETQRWRSVWVILQSLRRGVYEGQYLRYVICECKMKCVFGGHTESRFCSFPIICCFRSTWAKSSCAKGHPSRFRNGQDINKNVHNTPRLF